MPKAVVVKELCQPEDLTVEDVPSLGEPEKGQCLVKVQYAGVNFPDCLIIQGKYQFQPALPFSPGGEFSGVVSKVGPGVKGLAVGDHVIGLLGWGAFAEEVMVDSLRLIKVPKSMDLAVASSIMMTYGTTIHAFVQRGKLQAGETVLVLGAAGGVGIAAIGIAKAMGATVIAAASSDEKLAFCKEHGADFLINYSTENLKNKVQEITDGRGVDVVYDPVGDKFAEPAIRSLAWNGRYLVIGFAGGQIPKIPLNLYLLKGASAVGVFWGRFTSTEPEEFMKNNEMMFKMIQSGQLKPGISKRYAMRDTGKALRDMMTRKVTGKVVIACDPSAPENKQGSKL